jgi:ABC-type antimicrobial peptide transport system permease subunit
MKHIKIISSVFYLLALMIFIYSVWALMRSVEVIAEAIEFGQITVEGNLYDIISFYMANTGEYFIYAFILAGIGLLLHTRINEKSVTKDPMLDKASSHNDAELDEWFSEDSEEDLEDEENVSNN